MSTERRSGLGKAWFAALERKGAVEENDHVEKLLKRRDFVPVQCARMLETAKVCRALLKQCELVDCEIFSEGCNTSR